MPAGTITLTNNSTAVTGSGTSFTSELKANDFIVVVVGGVTYTLGVLSVDSATGVTLTNAYGGPTTSGLAWTAMPNAALVGITAQVAADVAKAIRGLNMDKANWQQVFSASGTITVNLPDGSQYSGPSWNSITTTLTGKMDKSQNLNDVANKTTAWNNLAVYGTAANTAAQGNDGRLNTVNGKTGGSISSSVNVAGMLQQTSTGNYYYQVALPQVEASNNMNNTGVRIAGSSPPWDVFVQYYLVSGSYHCMRLVQNGSETFRVQSNGYAYATTFNPTSDSNLKFNKEFLADALINTMTTRGMSYDIQNERKVGIIAQDVERFMPEAVVVNANPVVLEDGTILQETKSLDYSAIAGLHTEALKDVVKMMLLCLESPDEAKAQLQTLVSSINTSMADENKTDMKMEWALLNPPLSPPEEEIAEAASDVEE